MQKDFDKWNNQKKRINIEFLGKPYQERDIWWCYLGINIGAEEDGRGESLARPVLILKGFSQNACLVVPLTSVVKQNPYYVYLGKVEEKEASAIISQIRLIDTRRLINKIGSINRKKFNIIRQAIKEYL